MTGVTVRITFEIILVLGFGLPKIARVTAFGNNLAGPEVCSPDCGDCVFGDPPLLVAGIEDRGTIARAPIIALTVECGRIVDLKEKLQQRSVIGLCRIESDLDRFGVSIVVATG